METTPLQKSVERGISRNPGTTQMLFWLTWCPIRASLPRFLFPFSPQSDGSHTLSPMLVPQVPNTCARNPVQEYSQWCSSEQPRTSKGGHLPTTGTLWYAHMVEHHKQEGRMLTWPRQDELHRQDVWRRPTRAPMAVTPPNSSPSTSNQS